MRNTLRITGYQAATIHGDVGVTCGPAQNRFCCSREIGSINVYGKWPQLPVDNQKNARSQQQHHQTLGSANEENGWKIVIPYGHKLFHPQPQRHIPQNYWFTVREWISHPAEDADSGPSWSPWLIVYSGCMWKKPLGWLVVMEYKWPSG